MAAWNAGVLTLFPGMFPGPLGQSLAGKALEKGLWSLEVHDIREHAQDRPRTVDDAPFGGGPKGTPLIYFTPRGRSMDQELVRGLAKGPGAVMVCGRYEGLDQRVIDKAGLVEVSIGDYVLSGGEVAALVLLDAVIRLLPGVMGNEKGHADESFEDGLLEYPLYTQPRVWEGMEVPEVLASGDHAAIARWRREQAEEATRARRPDLWRALRKQRKDG